MSAEVAVADFGRSLGLPELSLREGGVACLGLDSGDTLTLEALHDELLVYLVHAAPHVSTAQLLGALQACDLRRTEPGPRLQVGLRGDGGDAHLVLLVRLIGRVLTAADIEAAVDALLGWQRRWAATADVATSWGR